MTDLADFLLARFADDERRATEFEQRVPVPFQWSSVESLGFPPKRVRAECDAKRRIVESARHTLFDDPLRRTDFWRGARDVADADLRFLALPYADHPDYREEWRP